MSSDEPHRRPKLFRLPAARRRLRGDIDRELRFHIEGRIDELVERGYTREQAEREVKARFGDVATVRHQLEEIDTMTHRKREAREWGAALARDVRYAVRGLAHRPGFTAVVVATLALGIGATTAIHGLLDAVVLRPLPYPAADRLVWIDHPVPGVHADSRWGMSQAGYFFFRRNSQSLARLAVFNRGELNVVTEDGAERARAARVSDNLFDVLGARPFIGRGFTQADTRPNAAPVVMLGYDYWRQRFNGDRGVVGTTLNLTSTRYEIIGVAPRGLDLPDYQAQVWLPLRLDPNAPAVNAHYLQAVARLDPGVTLGAAQAEAARLTSRLPEEFPKAYSERFMRESRFTVLVTPLRDQVVGGISRTLWILLGAVAIVLLIACANVANLFLVRAESRRREVAIRTALGAERTHIAGHYLAESVVLSLVGGVLGVALAYAATRMLLVFNPSFIPRLAELTFGWRPIATALLIASGTGVVFGLLPLLRMGAGGTDVETLRGGRGQTASRGQISARSTLIVAQVALAVVLLAAAGLMLRSFARLRGVHPGFDTSGVLTFDLALPWSRYGGNDSPTDPERYLPVFRFYQDLGQRLAGLPGVRAAVMTQAFPLEDDGGCAAVFAEGRGAAGSTGPDRLPDKDAVPCLPSVLVTPGYFAAMGIPVRGRAPTWSDMEARDGGVVVSKAFADRMWPGQDAIGKRLRPNGFEEPYYHVVGVAGDVRGSGLDKPPSEIAYYPMIPMLGAPLWSPPVSMTVVVRARTDDPLALVPAVRRILTALDREVPMANVQTAETIVSKSTVKTTFAMLLLGVAGAMALVLSAVGIYGVISYTVSQRRAEIGVRMALGARAAQVGRMVVGQSLRMAVVGIAIGVAGALAATRVMQSLLFGVSPTDPVTLVAVTAMLAAIGALASYLPARRAAKVDPVEVLRQE